MRPLRRVLVVGAGAWGTALAHTARLAGREVSIWARRPELAARLNAERSNSDRLPGIGLADGIAAYSDPTEDRRPDLVLLAVPAQHVRATLALFAGVLPAGLPLVCCAKGLELATGKLMSAVMAEAAPGLVPAVLSGPGFAAEVARGLPTAVSLAAADEDLGRRLAEALGHRHFRPYWTSDVIGVELGGALKNVLAIAAGIVEGRELGASAHAALVTRSFAELRRFAVARGARPETLSGLSGLGDLILTCGSTRSRNMALGVALGRGTPLEAALAAGRGVAEGVPTAAVVARIAAAEGLDMPVSLAVAEVLAGRLDVSRAIESLLARPFRSEG